MRCGYCMGIYHFLIRTNDYFKSYQQKVVGYHYIYKDSEAIIIKNLRIVLKFSLLGFKIECTTSEASDQHVYSLFTQSGQSLRYPHIYIWWMLYRLFNGRTALITHRCCRCYDRLTWFRFFAGRTWARPFMAHLLTVLMTHWFLIKFGTASRVHLSQSTISWTLRQWNIFLCFSMQHLPVIPADTP